MPQAPAWRDFCYVDDGATGLRRRIGPDGFDVLAANGRPIKDLSTLRRGS